MMPLDERELYRLHSKFPAHQKRVQKSQEIIREALTQMERPYAAVSFGKDSLVLMHMVIQERPDIPIVWSDRGLEAELPETYALIETLKEKYHINLVVLKPEISMFEIYRRYGLPEIDDHVSRLTVKEINLVWTFAKYTKETGSDGYFQGLRADESHGRTMMARKYGVLFTRKRDNFLTCNPLFWWTARDVWAYIVENKIPYHPEYDNTKFRSREEIRLSNWSGLFMSRKGRMVELKSLHPDLYQRLVNEFPEVRSLV